MPKLTVNYSEALYNLARAGDGPAVDGIEVGPWFSLEEIGRYKRQLAGWPFHFHAGSLVARAQYWPPSLRRVPRYLACTENQWLSVHIELLPWPLYLLGSRLGIHLPPPDAGRAVRRFVGVVQKVKGQFGLPVILENLASLPVKKYWYAAEPAVLAAVVEAADCGLLLDLAHARLAAAYRGQPVQEYVAALPLEWVRQVHVSGIRTRNGRPYDAHESMQEEDYALLAWTLDRCQPVMVTLEYFRREAPLRQQLLRLQGMVGE